MTTAVSAKSAQRAQFTFSTQGIVTHSQARGGEEAGASQKKNHERASKAAWDVGPLPSKVVPRHKEATGPTKDGLKEYMPQQVKDSE